MSTGSGAAGHAISLPSGGGAFRGIGESFAPDPFTGTASFSVPIATSPGRDSFGPALALQYSSGSGNGPYGLGWSLSIPSVTRKTDRGLPRYDDGDTFVVSGAEDLVAHRGVAPATRGEHVVERFRSRAESFARIERWTHGTTGDVHWRATGTDGITNVYGRSPAARLADPADARRVYQWLLEETFDARGNHIVYEYARDAPSLYGDDPGQRLPERYERNRVATQLYVRRICYGVLPEPLLDEHGAPITYPGGGAVGRLRGGRRYAFEVVFDYGDVDVADVPAPPPGDAPELLGLDVAVRADRFSSFRAGFELRTLRRCRRVLMLHHFAELGGPTLVRSTDFAYAVDHETQMSLLAAATVTGYRTRSGGGYDAFTTPPTTFGYSALRLDEPRYRSLRAVGGDGPGAALDDREVALVDLFGDGLPDVVQSTPAGWRYWRNLGGGVLDRPRSLPQIPSGIRLGGPGVSFGDTEGDGRVDLLALTGPLAGFYETTDAGAWTTFRRFAQLPSFDPDRRDLRLVDLTGDGRSDALVTAGDGFVWFESLGERGFGPPQRIARLHDLDRFPDVSFDDPARRVRLADMSGDGLSDIVLVHDGRVDYWPNLGYGRFGARITMADAPRFGPDFEPQRLFVVDVNGNGCADLVYVEHDRVVVWFNRAGNGWSPPHTIAGTPRTTQVDAVQIADVFGTGTATILWTYPFSAQPEGNYKALDLCGGQKPFVLVEMSNNLGSTTRVTYAASTQHFVDDQAAGTPWRTRLPFPVQVVDQVEAIDHVSGARRVTRFRYHHGYFDGREREFRGFARVDRFDAEEFADLAHQVPPVETRTWFHPGIRLADAGPDPEHYRGDADAVPLDDHEVDDRDTPSEAHRMLRGALLRSEVYARDGSARAAHPYRVAQHRHRVVRLQPRHGDEPAVYTREPLEELTYQYERVPDDPRISHVLTLEVDGWGNPLRSLAIGYPRRRPDPALAADDRAAQAGLHLVYEETRFTNAIDGGEHHRAPLECERRRFQLTGFAAPPSGARYRVDDWRGDGFAALDGTPRRLLDHVRSYFRADDLAGELPLGAVEPLALGGVKLRLAFTAEMIAEVYGDRVTDSMLAEGGYVHSEGDDAWWVSSGRAFYSRDPADPPAIELAAARRQFFLPRRYRDAFGNDTLCRSDAYALFAVETIDPLGNRTVAECDYRVLQPFRVTDPNGNRSEVAFDALGLVVASAVMGKPGAPEGDDLGGVAADLTRAQLDDFFADPAAHAPALLGRATVRVVRDPERFRLAGQPVLMATISRDAHVHGPPGGGGLQLRFAYSDGFGRAVQSKTLDDGGRWIGTGAVVLDNKGNPIRSFEPFFDDRHDFRPAHHIGASPIAFYDPLGRAVATVRADHAWTKAVFDAWRGESWDVHDTALLDPRTDPHVGPLFARLDDTAYLPTWHAQRAGGLRGPAEQDAAQKTAAHAATPAISHLDALGRGFLAIAHNRFERGGGVVDELLATRLTLDITGAVRAVRDAAGRTSLRFDDDVLGRRIHAVTLDGGERWTLADAAGQTLCTWDTRGHRIRTVSDALGRPIENWLAIGGGPEQLISRTRYGEGEADAAARNLRGRVVEVDDQAGTAAVEAYDFKGNALARRRRLAVEYRATIDWSTAPALEAEVFRRVSEYDAHNREIALTAPDGSRVRIAYDRVSRLKTLAAELFGAGPATPFVTGVAYNARGQRTHIAHGNGVATAFDYDPATFELTRFTTTRAADGARLQDATCVHDAAGNLTRVDDGAQATIYFANQVVTAAADYTYDAVGQLVRAQGREHLGQLDQPHPTWDDGPRAGLAHPGDGQAMRRYDERYAYDAAGNLTELAHHHAGGSWTRRYVYDAADNRLRRTELGGGVEALGHDAHGNVIAMPHAPSLAWNHLDQLRRVELGGGGVAFYVYDSGGHRVRKVVEKNGGALIEERIDLDGFEVFRRRDGAGTIRDERETLRLMDGGRHVALVETPTIVDGAAVPRQPLVRYQVENRQGGAAIELDAAGAVISYEEYYPYGGTSYQAMRSEAAGPKRYRFASKERDEESGFVYFGARYYAPWLGRWTAVDPAVLRGGSRSPFAYCSNDPINRVDPDGRTDYRDAGDNYVGSDGNKNGALAILLDSKDVSKVQDRYQGGWWRRHGGQLLFMAIGLLLGGLVGLLGGLAGAGIGAAVGGLAGFAVGHIWFKDMFWKKETTQLGELSQNRFDVDPAIRDGGKRAEARHRLPTAADPDRKVLGHDEDGNVEVQDFRADEKGKFHEEGILWGRVGDGPIQVFDLKPGSYADPTVHREAAIDPNATVLELPEGFVILGVLHVHPAGVVGTLPEPDRSNKRSDSFGGGGRSGEGKVWGAFTLKDAVYPYDQPPSDGDLKNARSAGTEFRIVVGARDGWVYFYDKSNTTSNRYRARIKKENFYR